jgi:MFS family permease
MSQESPATRSSRRAVITTLGITQILGWGSTYYLLSVLAKPISADTGWPLSVLIGGMSAGMIASGLVSPRVGRTIDRIGGRATLALSSILFAGGLVALGTAQNLPWYFAAWLIIGVGMGCGLYDAAFATLGRLYGAEARGAIGSLTLWGGFASTVCWPLSALLVETVDWRGTCFVYAAIQLVIALPAHLAVLSDAPPPALPAPTTSVSLPAATRRSGNVLPVLMIILTLMAVTSSVVAVHLVIMLQARGLDLAAAVGLGALLGPSQVAARVVERIIGHRYHPLWTLLVATMLIAVGLALLLLQLPLIGAALVLYGAGNGIYTIARGAVPLVMFGPDGYATLMGRLARPSSLASAIAPWPAALALETGGAPFLLAILTACALVAVALVGLLFKMRPAAR